ncbi:hypothetical protein V1477_015667 [Vespula maculifrons]|uniref:Uncharacterized protein n=1 Tax=Vespula maculifrons TaxID=7453 RepID=A0ABD2BAV7_VESMC
MNWDDKIRDAPVGALVVSEPNEYPFLASPRKERSPRGRPRPFRRNDLYRSDQPRSSFVLGDGCSRSRSGGRQGPGSNVRLVESGGATGENFCVGVDRRCATRTFVFSLLGIDLRASTIEGYAWTELDCAYVWFAPIYSTVTLRKGHILPGAMIVPC